MDDDGNVPDRRTRDMLADPRSRIGDVFVGLSRVGQETIESRLLDTRSLTALARLCCMTWGDLADKTIGDIWNTKGAGQLTVDQILGAAEAAADRYPIGLSAAAIDNERSGPSRRLVELHRILLDIANWAVEERKAHSLADVIGLSENLGRVPDEVRSRFDSLTNRSLAEFGVTVSGSVSPSLLEEFLDAIGERASVLVARRIRLGRRPTLEKLGKVLGVTRERVRQIEGAVARSAERVRRSEQFAPLRWRASDLREALGLAVPTSSTTLRDALEWATRDLIDPPGCTRDEFLLWLAGPYVQAGGWLLRGEASLGDLAKSFDTMVGDGWLVSGDKALESFASTGLIPDVFEAFLADAVRLRQIDDGVWVRWEGPVANKAEVVLRLMGSPSEVGAINAAIGEGHRPKSLRNVLASDSRFVRLDKTGTFGLAEWSLQKYLGIAPEIRVRIETHGGAVAVDDLIDELVNKFGVSESSVRTYATAPAFVVEDGRVRLRREDEPYMIDTRISRVRGLYVLPYGEVSVEIQVNHETLRGSGRPLSAPAAIALGVCPGERRSFTFREGSTIVVSWPETSAFPTLGSVRQAAESLGLSAGDRFRLTIDPDDEIAIAVRIDPSSLAGLTGLDVDDEYAEVALATAIGVDVTEVRTALRARGDDDVLAFLPPGDSDDDIPTAT